MTYFTHGGVSEIPNDAGDVYAFRVHGLLDDDTSAALADYVNGIFDKHENEVHLLLDLTEFEGNESGTSIFRGEVLKSRLRAVSNIGKYAVIGAPDTAERMINAMDKIIPVDARTFEPGDREAAWNFVNAQPIAA